MRVDRGRLNWGIFLIVVGAVPLAYHQGAISASALTEAWRLWPLIIVGLGLAFVLSRTPAYFVGGAVVAVCLGLVFGSALAVGPNVGCGGDGGNSRTVSQSGAFDGGTSVQLNLQCGSATVTTSNDGQWHVDATNTGGNLPNVTSQGNRLQISSLTNDGWSFGHGKDSWQVRLPAGSNIDLASSLDMGDANFNLASAQLSTAKFNLNLGTLHVDLTGAQVGNLNVSTNLGSAFVTLGDTSDLTGHLATNLGSLEVCVPGDLGLSVTSSDSLSSSDFAEAGLVRNGSAWQTTNYLVATHRATLTVDTSLGSVKFKHAGGC
jgi:Putative adhesin